MTSLKPRIGNLPREKWTDEAREVFAYWGEPGAWENGSRTNTMMTLANHPKLGMAFNVFSRQILLEEGVDQIGFALKTASGVSPEASLRPGEADDWAQKSGR